MNSIVHNKLIRKIVAVFTVLFAFIALISAFFRFLLPLLISHKLNTDINNAGSIGIIGGADGPTSIYISGSNSFPWLMVVFAVLAVLGVIYLIFERRKGKES